MHGEQDEKDSGKEIGDCSTCVWGDSSDEVIPKVETLELLACSAWKCIYTVAHAAHIAPPFAPCATSLRYTKKV